MSGTILSGVLSLLKENQQFPNYQAERRVDIFINYFLERILTKYFEKEVTFVCPEFPLKDKDSNRSTKLDYLCKTDKEVIFVELKTDRFSFKLNQAKIYFDANWEQCLADLEKISDATNGQDNKTKYTKLKNVVTEKIGTKNYPIKVVYIAPLPGEKSDFATSLKFENSKALIDIDLLLDEDEKIVFEHLCNLKYPLHIFEAYSVL